MAAYFPFFAQLSIPTIMTVVQFTFNPFQENTYLLVEGKKAWIVDPGCYTTQEQSELVDYIEENDLAVEAVVNTHCHLDHVLGNAFCCKLFSVPLWAPARDQYLLDNLERSAAVWGIGNVEESPAIDLDLNGETELVLGAAKFEILQVPGHTPGHVVLSNKADSTAIVGDVLFKGSIGRTDLPGGNHEILIKSIKEVLFELKDDTLVYSGHGPETTIGEERKSNPWLV